MDVNVQVREVRARTPNFGRIEEAVGSNPITSTV